MSMIYQTYFIPRPLQSKKGQEGTHALITWSSTEACLAIACDPIHQYRLGTALLKTAWVLRWTLDWKWTSKQCALTADKAKYILFYIRRFVSADGGESLPPSIHHWWGVQFGTMLFRGMLKGMRGSSRGFTRMGGMHQYSLRLSSWKVSLQKTSGSWWTPTCT